MKDPAGVGRVRVNRYLLCEVHTSVLEYVENETEALDCALQRLSREIRLFVEYRTRLITDVVTGKLDVREAAKHLPAEVAADEPTSEPEELANFEDVEL
ncbi:MAG: hypothetical protein SH850_09360 [Planctomycetaceae bacterium]|nr:hypothetical protein [Planctomycetaceae bacterium]